jgi:hypothetical protein
MITTQQQGKNMHRWISAAIAALLVTSPAFANIGRIKSAEGAVMIDRKGEKILAKPGVVIETGDIITAPAKARFGITFVDNSRVSARAGSQITIEKFDFDDTTLDGKFILLIKKGEVAIMSGQIAKSGGKAMLVRTPKSLFAMRSARVVVSVK